MSRKTKTAVLEFPLVVHAACVPAACNSSSTEQPPRDNKKADVRPEGVLEHSKTDSNNPLSDAHQKITP
jgi:hypothetical protein